MECREFLLRYSEYDDSLIPAHEANRFRSHMAECSSCARYDRVLRKGRMMARQLPRPEAGDDFLPRLRLRLHGARPRPGRPSETHLAVGLAAATVLMVAAAAVRVMDGAPPSPTPPAGAAAVTPAAAATRAAGRVVTLPPVTRPASPRAWDAREVAPSVAARYSPLETGPPVYRAARPSESNANPDRRALD